MLLSHLKEAIEKYSMLQPGNKVLVACSGGPDSLALLHGLWRLQAELSIQVVAAHLEHGFRGTESEAEAVFVETFCQARNIPCWVERVDMPEILRKNGDSLQEGARKVRYSFLRRVAKNGQADCIATGHQLEDQAETVLLHLLRGAGPKGLAAMQAVASDIIRPLLGVKRAIIEAYCQANELSPRRDSSNEKKCYQRNWLRAEIMPQLQRYNKALPETLYRTAQLLGEQQAYLQEQAQRLFAEVGTWEKEVLHVAVLKLKQQHIALQREVFRIALEKKRGRLTGITFVHVETLLGMLSLPVGTRQELPGALQARRTYQSICLEAKGAVILGTGIAPPGIILSVPGVVKVPELGLRVTVEIGFFTIDGRKDTVVIRRAAIKGDLVLRTRQSADRFQPIGMKGSKKVKMLFIDEKIPQNMRDCLPIICDAAGILWIAGIRSDERTRVVNAQEECIRITIERK